jgi:hypothetical protein
MKIKTDKSMPKRRSIPAIALQNFRSTSFHHKAEERGGASNEMTGYMSEYAEFQEDNQEEVSFLDLE